MTVEFLFLQTHVLPIAKDTLLELLIELSMLFLKNLLYHYTLLQTADVTCSMIQSEIVWFFVFGKLRMLPKHKDLKQAEISSAL